MPPVARRRPPDRSRPNAASWQGTASLLLGEGCSACRRLRMYLKLLPDDATALQKLREAVREACSEQSAALQNTAEQRPLPALHSQVALLSSTHLVHFAARPRRRGDHGLLKQH